MQFEDVGDGDKASVEAGTWLLLFFYCPMRSAKKQLMRYALAYGALASNSVAGNPRRPGLSKRHLSGR